MPLLRARTVGRGRVRGTYVTYPSDSQPYMYGETNHVSANLFLKIFTQLPCERETGQKGPSMMLKPRETGQKGPMMLKPRIRKVRPAKEGTKTGTVMDHVPGRRASSVHLQQRPRISGKDLHMFEIKSRPVVCWLNDIAAFGSGR